MKFEIDLPEHQYNNIIAFSSINIGRVPYKGIIMYAINAIKNATPVDQDPNVRHCFGCKYSKDNHNAGTEECHLCMWENQYTPTTKNDLGVDLISRADAIKAMQDKAKKLKNEDTINGLCGAVAILFDMPSVTPQEPVKKLEEQIKQLQNRCHALTHGQICVFCLYECEHKAESEG